MNYEANLTDHYSAVRARLRSKPEPKRVFLLPPPAAEVPAMVDVGYAPVNFLTPCSWRFLVALAAASSGVSKEDLLGTSRSKTIVRARQLAMALVYQHTQESLPAVGRRFGKDHTTVLHSVVKMGGRAKLVELLPSSKASNRPSSPELIVVSGVPLEDRQPKPKAPKRPKRADDPFTPRTPLQKAVARAYRHGIRPKDLAEAYGCNPRSVHVIAHKLGLKRKTVEGLGK